MNRLPQWRDQDEYLCVNLKQEKLPNSVNGVFDVIDELVRRKCLGTMRVWEVWRGGNCHASHAHFSLPVAYVRHLHSG